MTTTYAPQGWLADRLADKPGPEIMRLVESFQDPAHPERMLGQDDPFYAIYMHQVDRILARLCGMTHRDLVDYLTYDAYQAGDSPREVAVAILANDEIGAEILAELGIEDE